MANLVSEEHKHQLEKWGVQTATPAEWMMWLTEEMGELAAAISEYEYGRGGTAMSVMHEGTQVATLALKIVEMYLCSPKVLEEPTKVPAEGHERSVR